VHFSCTRDYSCPRGAQFKSVREPSIDPTLWWAEELELLWQALTSHPFDSTLRTAKSSEYELNGTKRLNLRRRHDDPRGGDRSLAGRTYAVDSDVQITIAIYDDAWFMKPDGEGTTGRSRTNFLGALTHELTHAAVAIAPTILDDYVADGAGRAAPTYGQSWSIESSCAGHTDPQRCKENEYLAIATAMYVAAPAQFWQQTLWWRDLDWHNDWLLNHDQHMRPGR
jgi:hypothetical protein